VVAVRASRGIGSRASADEDLEAAVLGLRYGDGLLLPRPVAPSSVKSYTSDEILQGNVRMTIDCLSRAPWPYPPPSPSLLSLRHMVQQHLCRYPSGHDCPRPTVQRGWGSRGTAHIGNSGRVAVVLTTPLLFLIKHMSITFVAACEPWSFEVHDSMRIRKLVDNGHRK
jgi:hypothetical protein